MRALVRLVRALALRVLVRPVVRPFVREGVPRVFPQLVFERAVEFREDVFRLPEKGLDLLEQRLVLHGFLPAFPAQHVLENRVFEEGRVELLEFRARQLNRRKFGEHIERNSTILCASGQSRGATGAWYNSRVMRKKLGEFLSTAVCGNDILSSALYVAGIAAIFAGLYAPIVLLAVGLVLFFYRSVYREVVEALPVNGGAYNALLNATSKTFAALAGVMTILSYVATAVISAKTAIEYLFKFLGATLNVELAPWVLPATALVLFLFAVVVTVGVNESARAAAGIFLFHLATLSTFVLLALLILLVRRLPFEAMNAAATQAIVLNHGGLLKTLFLAFSVSLLGVSGFESSANFVEEQERGVFAKTLRNMTLGVVIFNPVIAYVILRLLPLGEIAASKDFLLAEVASRMGGTFLLGWIGIDAFLVLSGAVLASYVGVKGLVNRMALDGCLPNALLDRRPGGRSARVIFTFFALCASILLLTRGELLSLAGVYTISFLGVMSLFAVGNLVLRKTREELQRPYRAPFPFVVIALVSTVAGLMGNIAVDPKNTVYFLTYFIPATFLVLSAIYRKDLYVTFITAFRFVPPLRRYFERKLRDALNERLYVFIHHLDRLAPIVEYIQRNENGRRVTLIHCKHGHRNLVDHARRTLETMHEGGFLQGYDYAVEYLDEPFTPELLDRYARRKRINKNRIFMGQIHRYHTFTYEELGGVRIIF